MSGMADSARARSRGALRLRGQGLQRAVHHGELQVDRLDLGIHGGKKTGVGCEPGGERV